MSERERFVCMYYYHNTVNGEALQMHAVYKKPYFYYKLSNNLYQYYKLQENLYQVLQVMHAVSECAMIMSLYDKIIITIVPSYTEKKHHLFVAICIVTCVAHS